MPYHIEAHPDQSIIVGSAGAGFDIGEEIEQYLSELKSLLDQMPGPVVYIADARALSMDFGDITGSMGMLTRGDLAVMRHPNLRAVVVITDNALIGMGVKALGQSQYGGLHAFVAPNLDEAVDIARREVAV